MKDKLQKFFRRIIDWITVWVNVLVVVFAVVFILLVLSIAIEDFDFRGNIFTAFMSGILGTALSCGFVFFGFRLNNKSKIIENQLELRKLFSEKQRREVHRTLRTKDKSYGYQKSGEEMPNDVDEEKWQESKAYKNHFLLALLDYIGLFEIAYMMIKEGQLSEKNFEVSYRYRLEELELCDSVMKIINSGKHAQYWGTLRKLMEMFPSGK